MQTCAKYLEVAFQLNELNSLTIYVHKIHSQFQDNYDITSFEHTTIVSVRIVSGAISSELPLPFKLGLSGLVFQIHSRSSEVTSTISYLSFLMIRTNYVPVFYNL